MPRYTLLLAGFLLLTSSATAQTAHPARLNVSVQGGVIRNLQPQDWGQPLYAFYPEVQITSRPFPLASGVSLQGGLHWGYWDDDGIREHKKLDYATYSQSSHIAGVHFYVVPTQIPLVFLSLFSGLSWHFVSSDFVDGRNECMGASLPECFFSGDYVGGSSLRRYWGGNYHDRFKALEAGLRVAVPLGNRLAVTTEVKRYIHISSIVERIPYLSRPDRHTSQFVYKLGLSFGFF